MRPSRVHSLALFSLLLAVPFAHADAVAGRSGGTLSSVLANNPTAVSWTQTGGYTDVSISAYLSSFSFSGGGQGTVYLTNSIGAGTTTANQLAVTTVSGIGFKQNTAVSLFTGLDLDPGTYYVVIDGNTGGGMLAFDLFSGSTSTATAGNTTGSDLFGFTGPNGYPPASSFDPVNVGLSVQYQVSGTPEITSVTPEPSSLILLGTGLAGVIGAARRRGLR